MPPSHTHAIVVIDPLSSGAFLKYYLQHPDIQPIAVYTMTESQARRAHKDLPRGERHRGWNVILESPDPARILFQLRSLRVPVVAVIPGSEPGVALAEWLAEQLGLPGNPSATTALRRDKSAMRIATQRAGLANPSFQVCRSVADACAFAMRCHFPVVVKALSSTGSDHVTTCRTPLEVARATRRALGATDLFGNVMDAVLVEEHIEGPEIAVELFAHAGGCDVVSVWQLEEEPTPAWSGMVSRVHLLPDGATRPELAAARAYAIAVCRALDIRIGPALVELRLHPVRGPMLIEACARLSGLHAPLLLGRASTFDPLETTIGLFTGALTTFPSDVRITRSVRLVLVPIAEDGEVRAVEGLDRVQALPSYFDGRVLVKPGDAVVRTRDQAGFAAWFMLMHDEPEQVDLDEVRLRDRFGLRVRRSANAPMLEEDTVPQLPRQRVAVGR